MKFSTVENLITFEENISLKVKVINVVLPPNTPIGQSISTTGIPKNTIYITGFLFNYIKEDATNIYDYWDLQISLPSNCIVKKKKEYAASKIKITKFMGLSEIQEWNLESISKRDIRISDSIIAILKKWNKEYSVITKEIVSNKPSDEDLARIAEFKEKGWI